MQVQRILVSFLAAAALFASAPTASAQEYSVTIGANTKRGHFGFSYDSGYGRYGRPAAVIGGHARRVWVPGCYELRERRVWIPGRYEKVWVEPVYETRYDSCGNPYQVLVCDGFWKKVHRPGHYEFRRERVWVPGHWKTKSYAPTYRRVRR